MDHTQTVVESKRETIKIITINKPRKKNAIDRTMYIRIANILNATANDDDTSLMVITGTGDYYSSGNDLLASMENSPQENLKTVSTFVRAFVEFPKLLVAVVNGPAIGIAATTLALCDLVFASENSFFYTPFTKLGFVAEGCSSFTFPRLIGDRKAAEMLLYNHKMSANEALQCGFINYVYKPEEFQSKVWDKITEVSKLPTKCVSASKKLLRGSIQEKLLQVNDKEIEELENIWATGEAFNNISKFIARKSKI